MRTTRLRRSEQLDGEQQIHRHAGQQHDCALARRLRAEAARIGVAALVGGLAVFARHAYEAPNGQQVDRVKCLATLDAEEPRREADTEFVYADAGPLRGNEVAELVDQHHQREDRDCHQPKQRHIFTFSALTLSVTTSEPLNAYE